MDAVMSIPQPLTLNPIARVPYLIEYQLKPLCCDAGDPSLKHGPPHALEEHV